MLEELEGAAALETEERIICCWIWGLNAQRARNQMKEPLGDTREGEYALGLKWGGEELSVKEFIGIVLRG